MQTKDDTYFMKEALREAKKAFDLDEVPVGAVVVHKGNIIARAHNQVEMLRDPTAHAEMIALTAATNAIGNKWLLDCIMYVTIEPCSMCTGALVLSRIKRIVYGAEDLKTGACGSVVNIANDSKLNHSIEVSRGVFSEECGLLLTKFFSKKRLKQAAINN
ncbi:tRNA adenosine(34) deaminase TadA [Thermoproteota archaeon]